MGLRNLHGATMPHLVGNKHLNYLVVYSKCRINYCHNEKQSFVKLLEMYLLYMKHLHENIIEVGPVAI